MGPLRMHIVYLHYNLTTECLAIARDSWRARVSHICELQVNLYSGAMKINFGGIGPLGLQRTTTKYARSRFANNIASFM